MLLFFSLSAFFYSLAFASDVSVPTPGLCKSEMDCSLNGDCVRGRCVCDSAFSSSPACDVMSFAPTDKEWGYHNATEASWGANVVLVDGIYHMFAAQFANGCGLAEWGSNSMIIRAESNSPLGPFQFKEIVVPAFSHNPTIRKGYDGAYYLFMIGDGSANPDDLPNCYEESEKSDKKREIINTEKQREIEKELNNRRVRKNGEIVTSSIHVTRAESIFGPWSPVAMVNFTNNSPDLCGGFTNPTPHFNPDGSVYLAFQAGPCDPNQVHGKALIGLSIASNWLGPYSLVSPDPVTPMDYFKFHPVCIAGVGEDPFFYRTSRGFHIIFHGMCPSGVRQAHYAFSKDGLSWETSPKQTYHYTVKYSDNSTHTFARVERPQLFFSSRDEVTGFYNEPKVLYNGVCGLGKGNNLSDFECVFDQYDGMTFTLARPLL